MIFMTSLIWFSVYNLWHHKNPLTSGIKICYVISTMICSITDFFKMIFMISLI